MSAKDSLVPRSNSTADTGSELGQVGADRRIGAAIGIIMVQRELSYHDAADLLDDVVHRHGRQLHDVAADITATGSTRPLRLDPPPGRPRTRVEERRAPIAESIAGRLLDILVETTELGDLLGAITELAVETVPNCESASITLIHDGAPATVATSDARALAVDETQYSDGQGPCLHAARTDDIVRVDDIATAPTKDQAWRSVAMAAGITASLSVPIAAAANIAAALNLYTGKNTGWSQQTLDAADTLATYAGDAITLAYRLTDPTPKPAQPLYPVPEQ